MNQCRLGLGALALLLCAPVIATQYELTPDAPPVYGADQYVKAAYERVCASIQSGMDELARRRRLPLFG